MTGNSALWAQHKDFCKWHVDWDDAHCDCGFVLSLPAASDVDHLVPQVGVNVWPSGQKIRGASILLGDGSYYDFESPETSAMTIEDFAWGLGTLRRFSGQTRLRTTAGHPRVFYSVAEHCTRGALEMIRQGYAPMLAYAFLMHEGGEPVCGDDPGPMKPLIPDKKALEKRCEAAAHALFGVEMSEPALIKQWDLRMLATEQRDLMPQSGSDRWQNAEDHPTDLPVPFDFVIGSCLSPEDAALEFQRVFYLLRNMTARVAA